MNRLKTKTLRTCSFSLSDFHCRFIFLITPYSLSNNLCIAGNPDTVIVNQLLDSGYVLEGIDSDKAITVYNEATKLSKKIGFIKGEAKGYHYQGIVYSDKSDYNSAFKNYRKALELYKSINYVRGIGACYANFGNLYKFIGKPDSAVYNHQAAVDIFKKYKQADALSQAYGNLGGIFQQIKQYEKSLHYFTESAKLARQLNDSSLLARALINQATALTELKQTEKMFEAHKTALLIAEKINDEYAIQLANINIADYYRQKKDYLKAIAFGTISLKYAVKLSIPYDVADIKKSIGNLYEASGDYDKAKSFYLEALEVSEEINAREISAAIYNSLHTVFAKTGEYKDAYKYLSLAQQYEDSVLGEKQLKIINELEIKYQSSQKDKELAQKQLQLEKTKQYVIYAIGTSLIALLLALLISAYYNYKRKIHLKQLNAIQQEKELQVLQALMQGEEKERTRIARDLHDEVAGMLAAAKMHIIAIASQEEENYGRVVGLLDEASVSVRKTAHNLMPEVLIHNGLDTALRKYCYNISNDTLTIQYDSWGETGRYSSEFELSVYRIVQELLNNVLKHSKATEAIVQVGFQADILSITVEDNGVGFDQNSADKDGTGMNSIKSRVRIMNGKMDIISEPGQGVSTYLEFEIINTIKQVA